MEIGESGIKGIGPKKVVALQDAGIVTVQDLASVDLRTFAGTDGVTKDNLKVLKGRARAVCRREGLAFEKATYSTSSGKKTVAPEPVTKGKADVKSTKKKGLFGRLLRN